MIEAEVSKELSTVSEALRKHKREYESQIQIYELAINDLLRGNKGLESENNGCKNKLKKALNRIKNENIDTVEASKQADAKLAKAKRKYEDTKAEFARAKTFTL